MAKTRSPKKLEVYRDPKRDVDTRVRDLLSRMTLEEKVRQLVLVPWYLKVENWPGGLTSKALEKLFGRISVGCLQDPRLSPRESAQACNRVQKYLVEKTRLGIPAMIISECVHGHFSPGATIFPHAIGMASTWNPNLVGRVAEVAAAEARAVGVAQALSPVLDLARDPRWGRVEETYGEDPYLVEQMGVAYIRGMQGQGPAVDRKHLVCTLKHFAGHGSPEGGLNLSPVAGSLRDLRTTYLPPFRAAVMEAGALSVMPCYSEYDDVPAHASHLLLTRVLREEWGFRGYVFSDYAAVWMLKHLHRTAATATEAGRQAIEAGMDLEAPDPYGYTHLLRLVRKGSLSMDVIDRSVERVLRVKFLAGLFENPYCDADRAATRVGTRAHRRLARDVAQESIVLLKNKGNLLPLDPAIGSIAVIGPNADVAQLGDYSSPNDADVTPLAGIRRAVGKRTKIRHTQGCHMFEHDKSGFEEAVAAAAASDVAVVVIGGCSSAMSGVGWGNDETPRTCGEGFDRADLAPPGVQEDLVKAIHATGTPTVVVMVHGRPYSVAWMAEHVPAIVEAWYPGTEGGTALAEILFGAVNPSGKLPVSVPRSVGHVPTFYNHKPSARGYYKEPGAPGKPGRDYVFSSPTPLYPFGHGLSYTTFAYRNLRVKPKKIGPAGEVTVSVDVRNSGKRRGREVVQLYVNDVVSSVTTPVKVLRRFTKIDLAPGATQTVTFVLKPQDLELLDGNMNWVVEPGLFEVMVGDCKATFEVINDRPVHI